MECEFTRVVCCGDGNLLGLPWGSKHEEWRDTKGCFALKEGQTIVGVKDTGNGLAFALSDDVRDERSSDF
jgi:hypothetical protein